MITSAGDLTAFSNKITGSEATSHQGSVNRPRYGSTSSMMAASKLPLYVVLPAGADAP